MSDKLLKHTRGFTLIELMMAMLISCVLILVVGVLLANGHRSWNRAYRSVHRQIKSDALAAMAIFNSVGRKSDSRNCKITSLNTTEVDASLDAPRVEFKYWHYSRDGRTHQKPQAAATHYAHFYFNEGDSELKVEYGTVSGDQPKSTRTFANVTSCDFNTTGANGCVSMDLTFTDPLDGEAISVKTITSMRN